LLRAPVLVVSPEGEYELVRGSLTIGRSAEVDIPLNDSLVSRVHARIIVTPEGVAIEDLHSTNGVYVNADRTTGRSQPLREGDRILIGTCELSVFGARRASTDTIPTPTALWLKPSEGEAESAPATDRADALQTIGRLAQRLFCSGNEAEAARVLASHLNKVLLGVSAGLILTETLLHQASLYALELLEWTRNGSWVDYVVELHLAAQQLPNEATLACMEVVMSQGETVFDKELFRYFLRSVERSRPERSLQEEAKLARLQRLLE